jgi:hypothetical protein
LAFSYWFDKPWFLTEGKLATVLIIPSSWGSQLGGYLPASDTAATDHLTNKLGKLHSHEAYHGSDKVNTLNGAGMPIFHIGQASLLTSHANRSLQLCNILRVPSMTRSLLSVPKLTYDNNVFYEFHPFDLFIKDQATRDVLLSGRLCHGVYRLEDPSVSRVFSGVRVSQS